MHITSIYVYLIELHNQLRIFVYVCIIGTKENVKITKYLVIQVVRSSYVMCRNIPEKGTNKVSIGTCICVLLKHRVLNVNVPK